MIVNFPTVHENTLLVFDWIDYYSSYKIADCQNFFVS